MKKTKLTMLLFVAVLFFACEREDSTVIDVSKSDINLNQKSLGVDSYLVIAKGNELSLSLKKGIKSVNGTIDSELKGVGLAIVSSNDPDFRAKAEKVKGIQSVVPNLIVEWINPNERKEAVDAEFANPPVSGDDDFFFDLQWGHDAVDAVEAWNAGYRGKGARVGILDGGFDLTHPDLQPNINLDLSTDFTGEGLQYSLGDTFSHGSHTAGTVGAADNGYGTIGIAPEAELVLIKVLRDSGSGSLGGILNGILHAATNEVDVINMSLGITLSRRGGVYNNSGELLGNVSAKDIAEYVKAYSRVTALAYQNGTTIIASAGNAGTDYDHSADLIHLPSDLPHVISISATAPRGWAANPSSTNLDELASYSNYGQSTIDFAAPGGDFVYAFEPGGTEACRVGPLVRPCYLFDYVFSTGANGGWYWSVGTSMAAPHATGVAAIIIGKNGGSMKPAHVEAALRASADDLGKPGNDDIYGKGRVNAYNAVE